MNKHARYDHSEKGLARRKRYGDRRVRMRAGGSRFSLGVAPTPEDAQAIRRQIREEAPRAAVQDA